MLRKFKLLLLAVMTVLATSCDIRSDLDYCGIYLEFIYDYNIEFVDSFNPKVNVVDVFVFDSEGKFLFCKQADCATELVDSKLMYLTDDLTFGTYKILAVGGLCDQFGVTDNDGSACIPGETTLENVMLSLQRESNTVSHEFPYIWLGEPTEIRYEINNTTWPVRMVQNTNKFTVSLCKYVQEEQRFSVEDTEISEIVPYTFEIVTPEGAVYGYDNSPLSAEQVSYTPYKDAVGTEPGKISVGQLNTARLFNQRKDYRLKVHNTRTNKQVWDYDLIEILEYTKTATNPDGSAMPMQEYLDRQNQWHIIILYDVDDDMRIIGVTIESCPWILWLHDIDF